MSKTASRVPDSPPSRLFRRTLLAAVLVQFVANMITMSPGVTANDGPEIAAAIVTLGVIHPTGYPLFTLIGHVFTWLPLPVEPVIDIQIMNACFAGGITAFVAVTVRTLALYLQGILPIPPLARRRLWPRPDEVPVTERPVATSRDTWEADLAGILAALLLVTCKLVWDQVRIPEVYTMHVFLVSWALYYWSRFEVTRERKYVLWAALPMGLGLAHHVTMVYMLPAAALYLLLRCPSLFVMWLQYPLVALARRLGAKGLARRTDFRHWWVVWAGCVIGALPLLFYGYFLWANATTSGISWGEVENFDRLYDHMTGRQYRSYMKGLENPDLAKRLKGLPAMFELQFTALAAVGFVVGLMVLVRRMWAFAVFFVAYAGANIWHAVQYKVGDFRNYYLPATVVVAIIIGVGLWWLTRRICFRPQGRSLAAWGMILGAFALLIGGVVFYYGHYAKPRPNALPDNADVVLVYPLVAAAGLAFVIGVVGWRRFGVGERAPRYPGVSLVVLGVLAAMLAAIVVPRARHYAGMKGEGGEYAAAVARTVPPGGVYMTLGDGKSFPMFYSQHVLNEGREFAVIDTRMMRRPWYRQNYLERRHPVACDPLAARYADDLELFFEECGTYEQRLDKYDEDPKTWLKFTFGAARASKRIKRDEPLDFEIKHGGDPRCQQPAHRRKMGDKCDCWDYNTHEREWDLACVYTTEEQSIIRMMGRELDGLHVVYDYINERPVFERTIFTRWFPRAKNGRQWNGPAYRRISGNFQLINRGPVNQVMYWKDIAGVDPCEGDELKLLKTPDLVPASENAKTPMKDRRYQVNPRPQLLDYSVIATGDDEDRFEFDIGSDIELRMHWFERNYYAPKKNSHMGPRVLHGVRVCFFDPDGKKIQTSSLRTTGKEGKVALPAESMVQPGIYTVQACSVGELGALKGRRSAGVDPDLPCDYPIMEHQFRVGEE